MGPGPISATTGSGEELRDAGRAGFDQLFNGEASTAWRRGRPASLERFTVMLRPVEPTKSHANGVLAGRKAPLIVARMCTRRASVGPRRNSRCVPLSRVASGHLGCAHVWVATFCWLLAIL